MKKQLLFTAALFVATCTTFAQEVWYDIDNSVTDLTLSSTVSCDGCTVTTEANPDAADAAATNVTLWKVPGSATPVLENKVLNFSFPSGEGVTLSDYSTLTVTVRIYFPEYDYFNAFDNADRFRLYLMDQDGNGSYVQRKLQETNEGGWHQLVFDFSSASGAAPISDIVKGEIRTIYQPTRFDNLDNDLDYYIDTISSNKAIGSITLSVDDQELNDSKLKLYPTSVVNTFETSRDIDSAEVYNLTGQKVKTFGAQNAFDVSNLAAGIYLFRAQLDNGATQTLRFIKE
ncbi:T9SS type A sorting domain-containing protein [Winogradskyella sp. F6397]|uniref:T9SS type A sorting domain-containing protein n=1 Tax=Winogradskyella marina TaxID=2785530 RepID=A0ABS0EH03_9FLAO|nr:MULTISPECIES: T9SS type A sorting domain-containing protein [Winogradskyella]MBF8148755.1 T9SS type A sorting domain-containing protein [Winogradskyella marina]